MEAYVAHALLQPRSYNITVPIDQLVMISENIHRDSCTLKTEYAILGLRA